MTREQLVETIQAAVLCLDRDDVEGAFCTLDDALLRATGATVRVDPEGEEV